MPLGTRGSPAPPQLCLSLPLAHIQACGMQPNKGLKTLKCSFSERPTFLKCQKSWKRQLAPLPAAWARQSDLNMVERCAFADPNKLEDAGSPSGARAGSPVSHQAAAGPVGLQVSLQNKGKASPSSHVLQPQRRNLRAILGCFQHTPIKECLLQDTCATPYNPSHTSAMVILAWNSKYAQWLKSTPWFQRLPVPRGYQCCNMSTVWLPLHKQRPKYFPL